MMRTRTQILLLAIGILLIAMTATIALVVRAIHMHGEDEMERFRADEIYRVHTKLKNLVDAAYATVDGNYRNVQRRSFMDMCYGQRLRDIVDVAGAVIETEIDAATRGIRTEAEAKERAAEAIREIRYAGSTGYLWINDMGRPIPKMIMHPTIPDLDGKVLDDPKFNCALGTNQNLFKAMVDVCLAKGEGMVDYLWPKPTEEGLVPDMPKLSYVRLFKEWGWVVGTGVYVDDAYEDAAKKSISDIRHMRYDDDTGYFWINDMGRPIPKMVMHPTIPGLDGKVLDDPKFNCAAGKDQNLFQAMVDVCETDGAGFVDYQWPKPTEDGGLSEPVRKISYVRLYKPLGWVIGTGVYVDTIDRIIAEKDERIDKRINNLLIQVLLASIVIAMLGGLLCSVASRSMTRPINHLVETMKQVAASGLRDQKVQPAGAVEFRQLGDIFNGMIIALGTAMDGLERTTSIRQRIESELDIAKEIQATILPQITPPFPDRKEFQVDAFLESARQVGGDFYDAFFVDDKHFCFSLGDVSDKGVPASLFMAVTKTLLKAAVKSGQPLAEAMAAVNRELSHDNGLCMFASAFVGVLEIETGNISYVNAGHCPPVIQDAAGAVRYMDVERNLVIGVSSDASFEQGETRLESGSSFVLYSDGITEAMDEQKQEFGEDRLLDAVRGHTSSAPDELLSDIRKAVSAFIGDAPQSDDITLLVLQYYGGQ